MARSRNKTWHTVGTGEKWRVRPAKTKSTPPSPPMASAGVPASLPSLSSLCASLKTAVSTDAFTRVKEMTEQLGKEVCSFCLEEFAQVGAVRMGCQGNHFMCPACLKMLSFDANGKRRLWRDEVKCPLCRDDIKQGQTVYEASEVLARSVPNGMKNKMASFRQLGLPQFQSVLRFVAIHLEDLLGQWKDLGGQWKDLDTCITGSRRQFLSNKRTSREYMRGLITVQDLADKLSVCSKVYTELEGHYVKKLWLPWLREWAATPTELDSLESAAWWKPDNSAASILIYALRRKKKSAEDCKLSSIQLDEALNAVKPAWRRWPAHEYLNSALNERLSNALHTGDVDIAVEEVLKVATLLKSVKQTVKDIVRPQTMLLTPQIHLWDFLRRCHARVCNAWRAWARDRVRSDGFEEFGDGEWTRQLGANTERKKYKYYQQLLISWYQDHTISHLDFDTLVIEFVKRKALENTHIKRHNLDRATYTPTDAVKQALATFVPPWSWDLEYELKVHGPSSSVWTRWRSQLQTDSYEAKLLGIHTTQHQER